MANAHRKRNFLVKIKVNGERLIGDRDLKEEVVGAFKTIVLEEGGWRPGVDALPFEVLDDAKARKLEAFFQKTRCWRCCWS